MAKRIFFVGYGGGHITMLIPIIHALKREGYEAIVLGLTTASHNLRRAGIEYIGFRQLMEQRDEPALEIGRKMIQELGNKVKVDREETISYLGLSYKDLIDRLGEEEASRQYKEKGRQAFLPLSIIERALRRFQPDLVVATNSPRSEKAAILTAGRLGIPSICIMDLYDPRQFKDRIGKPGYATRVCVFTEFVRKDLVEGGRRVEEVVVTGNPSFDGLADPDLPRLASEMIEENGWQGKIKILWARQANPNDWGLYRDVERRLFEILLKYPDWHLIIRPHPNDSTCFENLPERVSLSTQEDNLSALIKASDLIITVNSTVGIQGVAVGKPLINVEMGFSSPYTPYPEMGLSLGIRNLDDLEATILRALSPDYQPCERLPMPGGSTRRVIQVIKELIG